jgi:phosphate-selective porin OprO/OprP
MHLDARAYQCEDACGSPHSLDLRRARIDLQGRIHQWFEFRVQPELADKPHIRNAWVDLGRYPWLHLRAGQMKVPFSSAWATLDNNIEFIERGTSTPYYPYFDRGVLVWGEILDATIVPTLGIFTGAGGELDVNGGDIDDAKDIAGRLFLQPFKPLAFEPLSGLYLVANGTWGRMSVPTARYEAGGLRAPSYETAIWRWRTEQTIGSDGRVTDSIAASVDSRTRWGLELHYLLGPFALSGEYIEVLYDNIQVRHQLYEGASRKARVPVLEADATLRTFSVWASVFVTGEAKTLSTWGWKTAKPKASLGEGGLGAVEVLARYSRTWTDPGLYEVHKVKGFAAGDPALADGYRAALPGAQNSVKAAILDGAHDVHEATVGLSWTLNPMVRLQLNDVFLWAPSSDRDGDGENDNLILSGAKSEQADPTRRVTPVSWENAVMARLILKL